MQQRLVSLLAAGSLLAVIGCGLGDDDPPGTTHRDSGQNTGDGPVGTLAKPVLDPWDKEVCGASVPIQGRVPLGAEPVISGGLSSKPTTANPSTGRFCADVTLNKKTVNTLQVFSFKAGQMSEAVTIQVTQKDCKKEFPKDPPKPKPKMVSLGAKVTASKPPKSGNVGMISDGKTNASVVWDFYDWGGTTVWVLVKLDKLYEVDKVVVRWRDSSGSGSDYGKKYQVLIAQKATSDPNTTDGLWTPKSTVTAGDGGNDVFDYSNSKSLTRNVAVLLEENGGTGLWETFAFTEIEVWMTPAGTTTPPPTEKTCATIGS